MRQKRLGTTVLGHFWSRGIAETFLFRGNWLDASREV